MTRDLVQELAELEEKYSALTDDEIRGEMLKWKQFTPEYQAGEKVLKEREKERDPTGPLLLELKDRVANIEEKATRGAFKSWSTWLAIAALVVAVGSLVVAILSFVVGP